MKILKTIQIRLRDLAATYHSAVEHSIRCPRARARFHLIHGSAHATYFGGVAAHAFEFYGPVALGLFGLTLFELLILHGGD